MKYSQSESTVLAKYFSNVDEDIFVLQNLPEVIKGTLFSRYSRSAKDIRRLFLDEFFVEQDLADMLDIKGSSDQALDVTKAEDFYERILIGYGDDSVAELGGVHIALENISNIAAKLVEDSRLGISPLEKSSRYVFYDQKTNGKYNFYRDENITKSKYGTEYEEVMNVLFETYSSIVREFFDELMKQPKPSEVSDIAYKASCRAKACDVARYLLPLGTLTNVGLFGNGRAFEYLLVKLKAQPFAEAQELAEKMTTELRKVIPAFVKRAHNERGEHYVQYLQKATENTIKYGINDDSKPMGVVTGNEVKLVYAEPDAENKVITALLYPYSNLSYESLFAQVKDMSDQQKEKIIVELVSHRQNRHHKVFRGFEQAQYTFEIVSDIGAFRDLHRHRVMTQQRQTYTTDLGYIVPPELENRLDLRAKYIKAMDQAQDLFSRMSKDMPTEAQYIVPFGYRIRYYFHLNFREIVHLTELRSSGQGHPSYRQIAQEMAQQVTKATPMLGKNVLQWVDYKSYELERLEAFNKISAKAEAKGTKTFME